MWSYPSRSMLKLDLCANVWRPSQTIICLPLITVPEIACNFSS